MFLKRAVRLLHVILQCCGAKISPDTLFGADVRAPATQRPGGCWCSAVLENTAPERVSMDGKSRDELDKATRAVALGRSEDNE